MRTNWRREAHIIAVTLTALAVGLSGAPASAQVQPTVRINEVESSGGSPGDWIELVNTGTTAVDISKWVVKDNDNSHAYTIAKNT
ncbi:lamin tail domain-containing protein, partial [Streptomyces nojiriensis]